MEEKVKTKGAERIECIRMASSRTPLNAPPRSDEVEKYTYDQPSVAFSKNAPKDV
eukprot:SAG31_NODE_20746_length_566_cov_0.993576_2_plen_54_part_01